MGYCGCCIPGCRAETGAAKHRFPNPKSYRKMCQRWVDAINTPKFKNLSLEEIRYRFRVCHKHFESKYVVPSKNGRLHRQAIPTLHVPCTSNQKVPEGELERSTAVKEDLITDLLLTYENMSAEEAVFAEHAYSQTNKQETPQNEEIRQEDQIQTAVPPNDAQIPIQVLVPPQINKPPYIKELTILNPETKERQAMCRICFQAVKEESEGAHFYANKEIIERDTKLEELLLQHFSTLNLEIILESIICKQCIDILEAYEKLKVIFKLSERKMQDLQKEIENPKNKDKILTIVEDTITTEAITDENPVGENSDSQLKYLVKTDVRLLCEICGDKFYESKRLRSHLNIHRREEEKLKAQEKPRLCEKCGLKVKNAVELRKHSRIHNIIKCPRCGKIFHTNQLLKSHITRTHEGRYKIIQCQICGKNGHVSNIRTHMQTHGPKTHFCDRCTKSFWTKYALEKHKRRHVEQPYSCDICCKQLKYKESLVKHLNLVHFQHGDINCNVCGKTFWKKYDLQRHINRMHGLPKTL